MTLLNHRNTSEVCKFRTKVFTVAVKRFPFDILGYIHVSQFCVLRVCSLFYEIAVRLLFLDRNHAFNWHDCGRYIATASVS